MLSKPSVGSQQTTLMCFFFLWIQEASKKHEARGSSVKQMSKLHLQSVKLPNK